MSNLKTVVLLFVIAAVCVLVASGALAQPNTPASSGGSGGVGTEYVLPYMVVILALVLGMMVAARGSNRRERERPAGYVEKHMDKE
jgi:hypothetical protein